MAADRSPAAVSPDPLAPDTLALKSPSPGGQSPDTVVLKEPRPDGSPADAPPERTVALKRPYLDDPAE